MADVDCIRTFVRIHHLTRTLAARCPNGKTFHKNSLCFMVKIIFQLLSCLYVYDSRIPVPVCIRKQSLYTDVWRLALIHRAVGIQTSGAGVDILCRRYTDFWRRREVCANSVYRLMASKGLTCQHFYKFFFGATIFVTSLEGKTGSHWYLWVHTFQNIAYYKYVAFVERRTVHKHGCCSRQPYHDIF